MPEQQVSFTPEQLQQLISFAIREAKRPTEEEQEKIDAEKAAVTARNLQRIEFAKREIEMRENRQAACGHKKPNGRPSIGGQVNSDGLVHPICVNCQWELPPITLLEAQAAGYMVPVG